VVLHLEHRDFKRPMNTTRNDDKYIRFRPVKAYNGDNNYDTDHVNGTAWLRWLVAGLSPRRPGLASRSVHVGLVVDKVATGTGFSPNSSVSPVNIIPPWLSTLVYHLGMNNRPVSGRSSETESRTIDMNNKIQS
jgi:hypothetical protein